MKVASHWEISISISVVIRPLFPFHSLHIIRNSGKSSNLQFHKAGIK